MSGDNASGTNLEIRVLLQYILPGSIGRLLIKIKPFVSDTVTFQYPAISLYRVVNTSVTFFPSTGILHENVFRGFEVIGIIEYITYLR